MCTFMYAVMCNQVCVDVIREKFINPLPHNPDF